MHHTLSFKCYPSAACHPSAGSSPLASAPAPARSVEPRALCRRVYLQQATLGTSAGGGGGQQHAWGRSEEGGGLTTNPTQRRQLLLASLVPPLASALLSAAPPAMAGLSAYNLNSDNPIEEVSVLLGRSCRRRGTVGGLGHILFSHSHC